jgi:hypothetical protein
MIKNPTSQAPFLSTTICKFCKHSMTVTRYNYKSTSEVVIVNDLQNAFRISSFWTSCPNPACMQTECRVSIRKGSAIKHPNGSLSIEDEQLVSNIQHFPQNYSKPLPDYIPLEIRKSYQEACAILELSPKASAAMSRRCLQGMVRNFWKIPKAKLGNLGAEISYIKDAIPEATVTDIINVRKIGDIGAHMDKNIDFSIDLSPGESQILIELLETLFEDWYILRHQKELRRTNMNRMVAEKQEMQREGKILSGKTLISNTENRSATESESD